jgi:hypothetical protein
MKPRLGLALLVVLFLVSTLGVLCLVLGATRPARVDVALASSRLRLRQDAIALVALALGEVQQAAGDDVAATWQDGGGAWVSRLSTGGRVDSPLVGERLVDGNRWRWRCDDVSCGFDLSGPAAGAQAASGWARSQVGSQALPGGGAGGQLGSAAARALELEDEAFFRDTTREVGAPGTSWGGRGLLTDAVRGGWRRDLASVETLTGIVGAPVAEALVAADLRTDRALGLSARVAESAGYAWRHSPVLVDLRLSLGFFNARSDGRHRLRFHVSGLCWNPSSAPLLADGEGRLALVEVIGAPEITVRNLDSGAAFAVSLDDCPVADFGIFSQYRREAGLWAWCEVADVQRYGMARRGLLPGECHAFISPSPASQPQGLARVLIRETWRYDATPHGPTWKRPSPQTFLPTDRIEITARFLEPLTVRLHAPNGTPERDLPIADYPSPVFHEVTGVWFPDFRVEVSGRDYTREDSAGYTIAERRACLRLGWGPRDGPTLRDAVRAGDLLRARWDLTAPEAAAQWVVEPPLVAALAPLDWSIASRPGVLTDEQPDVHLANTAGAFATHRLRALPGMPLVSVGALRHLTGRMDWSRLDDAFCSAPLRAPEAGRWSDNPRLRPWGGEVVPAGPADWYIAGPFNVNSLDPQAWLRWLRGADQAWQAQAGGPFAVTPVNRPFWVTDPAGAHLATWAVGESPVWTDERLLGLEGATWERTSSRQAVRFPTEATLAEVARQVVRLAPSAGWPYRSLEAFASSGLLDRALAAAKVNTGMPGAVAGSPLELRGEDLLEAWAPLLTVRGDTLRLVGTVSSPDPGQGGQVRVEAWFQRRPERLAGGRFGRVWRVVKVRLG